MSNVDLGLFLFSIFDGGVLLFLQIYSAITLSDLECDYINPKECCLKLNRWIIPEYIAYLLLIVLFLITEHWILFLSHLPMLFLYDFFII